MATMKTYSFPIHVCSCPDCYINNGSTSLQTSPRHTRIPGQVARITSISAFVARRPPANGSGPTAARSTSNDGQEAGPARRAEHALMRYWACKVALVFGNRSNAMSGGIPTSAYLMGRSVFRRRLVVRNRPRFTLKLTVNGMGAWGTIHN